MRALITKFTLQAKKKMILLTQIDHTYFIIKKEKLVMIRIEFEPQKVRSKKWEYKVYKLHLFNQFRP